MAGILRPFQIGPLGIFTGSGDRLRESRIGQIIGMRATSASVIGEWEPDPSRGSALESLRNAQNSPAVGDFAAVYVQDAFEQAIPEERLVSIDIELDDTTMKIVAGSVPIADRGLTSRRVIVTQTVAR